MFVTLHNEEEEQMRPHAPGSDKKGFIPFIKYQPELKSFFGSSESALIFQKLEYWSPKYPNGFWKFHEPCTRHPQYRKGDSWQEELGFSRRVFLRAFSVFGIHYKSKSAYLKEEKKEIKEEDDGGIAPGDESMKMEEDDHDQDDGDKPDGASVNGKGSGSRAARTDEVSVDAEGNQVMIRTIPPDIGRAKLEKHGVCPFLFA